MFWPALATAVSSWWLLTGLALLLAHQSGKRARAGFMLVSVLALAALLLVPFNASLNTPNGSRDRFYFRVDHLVLVRNQLFAWIRKRTQSPAMSPRSSQSGIASRVLSPQLFITRLVS